jgi:hypothetical protein
MHCLINESMWSTTWEGIFSPPRTLRVRFLTVSWVLPLVSMVLAALAPRPPGGGGLPPKKSKVSAL